MVKVQGPLAGCSKRPSSKAADESKPEAYLFSPALPKLPRQLASQVGYVEDFDEPRTRHGERRVSARWGWAGEKGDVFSILLDLKMFTQGQALALIRGAKRRAIEPAGAREHPVVYNLEKCLSIMD